jgi:hypothetical protein
MNTIFAFFLLERGRNMPLEWVKRGMVAEI